MDFCQIILICKNKKQLKYQSCFLFLSRPSFVAMVGRVRRLFARADFASGASSSSRCGSGRTGRTPGLSAGSLVPVHPPALFVPPVEARALPEWGR